MEINKENQQNPGNLSQYERDHNTRYQGWYIELFSCKLTDWTNYFPAVKIILLYKFRDPIGSGKVNSKTNTEAKTSLTAGK